MYRSLLHLSWIDKLVDNIKTLFVDLYGDQLRKPYTTGIECHFDKYFDQQVRELEATAPTHDLSTQSTPPHIDQKQAPGDDEPPPIPGLLSRGMLLVTARTITLEKLIFKQVNRDKPT